MALYSAILFKVLYTNIPFNYHIYHALECLIITYILHVQALEKHCRSEAGYSGIQNVYMETPQKDDVQQSFIFAETFKVPVSFKAILV